MEYRLDGSAWTKYKARTFNAIDFSGDHILDVRYAAAKRLLAGPITTLTFTTNPVLPPDPVKPDPPNVSADDVNNTVVGIDSTMEFKLSTDSTYTLYNGSNLPDLSGEKTLLVRVAAEGVNPASDDTPLTFTTNPVDPVQPPAPNVSADDVNNTVVGIDSTMEFKLSTDSTYTLYNGSNLPDLSGDKTLLVRVAAEGVNPASPDTTLNFTTNPVQPPAPNVTADDVNNTVVGIDSTMEFRLSTDSTYTLYNGSNLPDLSGEKILLVRVAAEGVNPAGPDTTLNFTTNPVQPPAPNVTADDVNNTVVGIDSTMEFRLSTDSTYTLYNGSNLPDLTGEKILFVRVAAVGVNPASDDTPLSFTTNPAPNARGKVLFTFDDAWLDQYENAFPIMESVGFDGTIYAVRDIVIGTSPLMMRLPQLKEMYDAGWDVSNHTINHKDFERDADGNALVDSNGDYIEFATKTDPETLAELKTMYLENQNWIVKRVGEQGAFHVAYPSGLYTPELIQILKDMGVITARIANNPPGDGFTTTPTTNFYELPVISLESWDDALDYALPAIDQVVADGSTVIFMIHRVGESRDDLFLHSDDLRTIVNYAKGFVDAGTLDVMTFSEWYAASTTPETPAQPAVFADDAANTVSGMAAGMEYNLNGTGYVPYVQSTFDALNDGVRLDGHNYLLVRQAATGSVPAGQPKILVFKPEPGSGKVLFTFDDGWKGQFANALPILEAAGFEGTAYVNKNSVDWDPTDVYMDLAELETLYQKGWDISNHTTNHANLTVADWQGITYTTPGAWDINYLGAQEWLETATDTKSAWTRGARHVNYPDGQYNEELIAYLKGIGVLTGRTSEWGQQQTIGMTAEDFYKLKVVAIDNSDPWYINNAKNAVDDAVMDGTTIIFMIHSVEPAITSSTVYPGITLLSESLEEIVQHTKSYSDNGDLSVMTISEWYDAMK
ncbi:polysaccharide deacetylase family protein [Anaerotalea alkaliphila]|uniref:Polysaccharide deacetylase family protein n=1 Tax=Anaerotalea alkaliphila TaxID=2662126 RepID=A0A7X5KPN2_9FIRM|nr:polysaccharide deacetylase family protein [Anaerotalea alkaliphila]NDL68417.1 polysaccharide deacetylase family protein [Anaerotalea alkaliphila]